MCKCSAQNLSMSWGVYFLHQHNQAQIEQVHFQSSIYGGSLSFSLSCMKFDLEYVNKIITRSVHLSHDARKPVFVVSEQVRHNPVCSVTEIGNKLEISDLGR